MYRIIVDIFRKAEAALKHSFRFTILFFIFGDRQGENKFRTDTLGADTIDIFTMCLNDLFYNGKSKTGAAFIFSAGEVGFVKSFPDLFQTIFWNTDSGVFDRNKDFLIFFGCLNRDHRILMTELDRIINQIVEYLLDFAEISSDKQLLTGENQVEADMFVGTDSLKSQERCLDRLVDIKIRHIQHNTMRTKFI